MLHLMWVKSKDRYHPATYAIRVIMRRFKIPDITHVCVFVGIQHFLQSASLH